MRILKEILLEALDEQQKEFVDLWHRGDYSFSNHAFGNNPKQTSLTIPLKKSSMTPLEEEVHNHINNKKYEKAKQKPFVLSYKDNQAIDHHGRPTSVSNLLKDNVPLLNKFNNDPSRDKGVITPHENNKEYYVKISRHPHDVAGMSTDQKWTSCMDMDGGCNKSFLADDIEHGTHVAYLHEKGNDKNPIARIALKPWVNNQTGEKTLSPEETGRGVKHYGQHVEGFGETVKSWLKDNNFKDPKAPEHKNSFKKVGNVYDDTNEAHGVEIRNGQWGKVNHHFEKVYGYDHDSDRDSYYDDENDWENRADEAASAHRHHIHRIDTGQATDDENYNQIGHRTYEDYLHGDGGESHQELIHAILTSPHHFPDGRHPISQRTFDNALDYVDELDNEKKSEVGVALLGHHHEMLKNSRKGAVFDLVEFSHRDIDNLPNNGEHILHNEDNLRFNYAGGEVSHIIDNSPSLNSGNKDDIEDYIHKMAHSDRHKITQAHENNNDIEDYYDGNTAPQELKNITSDYINRLSKNYQNNEVSASHKKDIDRMLTHPNEEFRKETVKKGNLSSEQLHTALNDKSNLVRYEAVSHINADTEHHLKGLDDREEFIQNRAWDSSDKNNTRIVDKGLDNFFESNSTNFIEAVNHSNPTHLNKLKHFKNLVDDSDYRKDIKKSLNNNLSSRINELENWNK